MRSTTESGHSINVANFLRLIEYVESLGSTYTPPVSSLQPSNLRALHQQAKQAIENLNDANSLLQNATNLRQTAFKDIDIFANQVINYFSVFDVPEKAIDDARSFLRKMQGTKTQKSTDNDTDTDDSDDIYVNPNMTPPAVISPADTPDTDPVTRAYSTSQRSFVKRAEHFSKLISRIAVEPDFMPNAPEYQISTLQSKAADIVNTTAEVVRLATDADTKRINRSKVLYTNPISIYKIAKKVKNYLKSLFPRNTPEHSNFMSISFSDLSEQ